jgi:hydrogenase 3 maturation protease
VVEAEEVPESCLDLVVRPGPDTVVLVDAVELGEPPGAVALLEMEDLVDREASTHRAPLSLLAHYIRSESGADVFVLALQPGCRQPGTLPCAEVTEAAGVLADLLETAAVLASLREAGPTAPALAGLHVSLADPPEVPC